MGSIVSPKRWIAVIVAPPSSDRASVMTAPPEPRTLAAWWFFIRPPRHRLDVRQAEQATDAGAELGHVLLAEDVGLLLAPLALEGLGANDRHMDSADRQKGHASGGSRTIL